jgi:accessory colonization factor AcfC
MSRHAMISIVKNDPPFRESMRKLTTPGQIVVAFQGGGALNAYQGGVYPGAPRGRD